MLSFYPGHFLHLDMKTRMSKPVTPSHGQQQKQCLVLLRGFNEKYSSEISIACSDLHILYTHQISVSTFVQICEVLIKKM